VDARANAGPQRSPRITVAELLTLRPTLQTLTHLSFVESPSLMTVTGAGPARRMQGLRVAPGYFDTLGVSARLGRTFGSSEEAAGASAVLILSHDAWQTQFGGDPDIVGRSVTLASVLTPNPAATMRSYTVVGVMPEGFDAISPSVEFWVPTEWDPKAGGALQARLADGATLAAAHAELGTALRSLRGSGEATRYELQPALDEVVAPVRRALLMLLGAASCVLLIACVNVANLTMARTNDRRREIAVRTALGAGRLRLVRHLTVESLLLALAGGVVGTWVAFSALAGLRVLATTMARMDLGTGRNFPRLGEVSLDTPVLLFVAVTSLVVAGVIGLLPAFAHARSRPVVDDLRASASTGTAGFSLRRRGRSRAVLVTVEIALAMALLIGGGLMIHSFARLSSVKAGFDPANVITFQIALPPDRYPLARLKTFADEVVARVQRVPGARSTADGGPDGSFRPQPPTGRAAPPRPRRAGDSTDERRLSGDDGHWHHARPRLHRRRHRAHGQGHPHQCDPGRTRVCRRESDRRAGLRRPRRQPVGDRRRRGGRPAVQLRTGANCASLRPVLAVARIQRVSSRAVLRRQVARHSR
jgi:predicted permease